MLELLGTALVLLGPDILALVSAYFLTMFLIRYTRRFYANVVIAFCAGAITFLLADKILAIAFTFLINILVFTTLGSLFGAGSAGAAILENIVIIWGYHIYYTFIIITTVLACVVGYKHARNRAAPTLPTDAIAPQAVPPVPVPTPPPANRLGHLLFSLVGVVVFLVVVMLPLWSAATTALAPMLAATLQKPELCLWMPEASFDYENPNNVVSGKVPGIDCLRAAQTEEEYYSRCDLIPESMRESLIGGFGTAPAYQDSPYQECILHGSQLAAENGVSSTASAGTSADNCRNIQDIDRRAVCLLPYIGSPAWSEMCAEALIAVRGGKFQGDDAIIIGRCLDNKTVNEKLSSGRPIWFNFHVASGFELYNIPVKRDEILQWLKSIGVNPNLTAGTPVLGNDPLGIDEGSDSATFLVYLLDVNPGSELGKTIKKDDFRALLDFGIDPRIKDKSGLTAIDYAVKWGNIDAVELLLPYFKGYTPKKELADFFLKEMCDFQKDTNSCFSLWPDEQANFERARLGFIKLGFIK